MNPAEEYIFKQIEPFRSILMHLQVVVEHTIPEVEMKFKYRVPYFYIGKTPICYMNQAKDYVDLGFWGSAHLTIHTELMCTEGRKVVKSLRYRTLEEINDTILIDVLKDAYSVKDKGFWG